MIVSALMLVAALSQDTLSFSDKRWALSGDSTRIETIAGRQAVVMHTGAATRKDFRLENGTIDVDVMTTRRRSFVYVKFRMLEDSEHEEFYLRPHKSDLPDATQYAPVYRGQSAWQLYYGDRGTSSPVIEPGVWQRLRIVLSGRRMAVFLRDTITPVLDVELARPPAAGYLSLSSFLPPGTPGSGPVAYFADLRVRPGVIAYVFGNPVASAPPSGIISRWSVGEAFIARTLAPTSIDARWRRTPHAVEIEPNGMVELNRWIPMPTAFNPAARQDVGALATVTIDAEQAGVKALQLGFSDAATVFLNGQPLMHRDDSYLFSPQRRDGLIGFDQSTVYLPLRKGRNELAVMVTDHFGGWGLMARLPDMQGLRVTP